MEAKVCTKCGEEKFLDEFYRLNKKSMKRYAIFKVCLNRQHKEYYKKTKESKREYNTLTYSPYGLKTTSPKEQKYNGNFKRYITCSH